MTPEKLTMSKRMDGLTLVLKLYGIARKRGVDAVQLGKLMHSRYNTANGMELEQDQLFELLGIVAAMPRCPIEARPSKERCSYVRMKSEIDKLFPQPTEEQQ
jgi:hypothetical protein